MKLRDFLPPILTGSTGRGGSPSAQLRQLHHEVQEMKILAAQSLIRQTQAQGKLARLADAEFKVFSQFGDDGIIQYLIHYLQVEPTTFVEFGVQDYSESNTRFLLINDNWRGLIMDGSQADIDVARNDDIYWRYDLTAVTAFIDRDNINGLIKDNGFTGELGLLSVDIDGNDYWVWENITCVQPAIVVAEYNSVFGASHAVTVPYQADFVRSRAHFSYLYWGTSLKALCFLAEKKGYAFVGCNSNGNNAYFVMKSRMEDLQPLSAEEGYVESRFRESRNENGKLSYVAGDARRQLIKDMPLVDVESGDTVRVGDLG